MSLYSTLNDMHYTLSHFKVFTCLFKLFIFVTSICLLLKGMIYRRDEYEARFDCVLP
jgi:hypothetical protein